MELNCVFAAQSIILLYNPKQWVFDKYMQQHTLHQNKPSPVSTKSFCMTELFRMCYIARQDALLQSARKMCKLCEDMVVTLTVSCIYGVSCWFNTTRLQTSCDMYFVWIYHTSYRTRLTYISTSAVQKVHSNAS